MGQFYHHLINHLPNRNAGSTGMSLSSNAQAGSSGALSCASNGVGDKATATKVANEANKRMLHAYLPRTG